MATPVLIIEDDPDIAEGLRYNLEREKLSTRVALSGEEGLAASLDARNPPALILLDLMLPGMSGTELCRRLRREPQTRRTPIIMVTASTAASDIAAGLDLGADDYITKPFSMRELIARVHVALRRVPGTADGTYRDARLCINYAEIRVTADGRQVRLTRREFALLSLLVMNQNRVLTREKIMGSMGGHFDHENTRKLDLNIQSLRQQLGGCSGCIETIVGVGYRFVGYGVSADGNTSLK